MTSDTALDGLLQWLRVYAAQRIHSQLMDERRCLAPHIVLDLGNRGLLGMQVPRDQGGLLALSHWESMRIQRQLGAIDLTLAFFVGLNNALGVRPLLRFAAPPVQQRYLPDLASGRLLGAFALSEPGAGSNPLALGATAQRESRGFVLTGTKLWCGSAAWAGVISVFARHTDPQGRLVGHVGLVVDAAQTGMRVGLEAMTMGLRGMVQNAVHFDHALVEPGRVLGSAVGGLSVASEIMAFGRLGIAATAVGGIWRALQLMLRYGRRRNIHGGYLCAHGHSAQVLRDTWLAARVLGQFVDTIASALDRNQPLPGELYAAAKLLASESLWHSADAAMQMLGGRGYCDNNGASQLLRDARITRLFEGPSEALASYIGQRTWMSQGSHLGAYFASCHGAGAQAQLRVFELLQTLLREPPATDPQSLEILYLELGYAVAWQLVAASMGPSGVNQESWLQHRFQRAAQRTLQGRTASGFADPDWLAQETRLHIGDLEQTASGADHQLDDYLRL